VRFETTCRPCGKRTFRNRRAAQSAAKVIPGRHMNAYRCAVAPGWHLGHLPLDVVQGKASKADYEARVQRRRAS
jgi:hypothetical protein